jgi:imidazolonepropionase-like amidohydrolase
MVAEARTAVQDYIRIKTEFIKIWVDSRGGRKPTLTPPLYRAIIDEAHKYNVPVAVHNVTLADAKELMRAGHRRMAARTGTRRRGSRR